MTAQGLIEHLDHARRRGNMTIVLCLVALLAWWMSNMTALAPSPFGGLIQNQALWHASSNAIMRQATRLNVWAKEQDPTELDKSIQQLTQLGSILNNNGENGDRLSFLALSNEYDRFVTAWKFIREKPFSSDHTQWTSAQLKSFSLLQAGYSLQARERQDLSQARTDLNAALAIAKLAPKITDGLADLVRIEHIIDKLKAHPSASDAKLATIAAGIVISMESLGIEKIDTLTRITDAHSAKRALELGSLEVVGFSISGIVVRLLLPAAMLVVSLDLLLSLRRTARFTRQLPSSQVQAILGGYPWLFSPKDIGVDGSARRGSRVVGTALLIGPTLLTIPLVLSGPDPFHRSVGLLLLAGAAAAQLLSVGTLLRMTGSATPDLLSEETLRQKLALQHFKAATLAFNALWIACVTVISFFLVFLIIPKDLLVNTSSIHATAMTRQALGIAYDQRLLEHRKAFSDWCATTCDKWVDFSFALNNTPISHPAHGLLAAVSGDPIVKAEMSATSRVKDLVTESGARFGDLDPEDVNYILEILYRDSFQPLVDKLGRLQRVIATHRLPPDAEQYLPEALRAKPVEGISVPFTAPYRVIVELGGFADKLTPLPPVESVQSWMQEMVQAGATRVSGFDLYQSELAAFEMELGKMRLKIAGSSVPRSIATDVSLITIAILSLSLAVRLRAARLLTEDMRIRNEPVADLSNLPGVLFIEPTALPSHWRWFPNVVLFGMITITQVAVIASPVGSSLNRHLPAVLLVLTIGVLAWALAERRAVILATRPATVN